MCTLFKLTILFFYVNFLKTPQQPKEPRKTSMTLLLNETKDAIIIVSLFLAGFTVSYKLQKVCSDLKHYSRQKFFKTALDTCKKMKMH